MITLTKEQFNLLREAISGAHLTQQSLYPLLKERHVALDKKQRQLLEAVPPTVDGAFELVVALTAKQNASPGGPDELPTIRINDIDVAIFRAELENIAALNSPDLDRLMIDAIMDTTSLNDIVCTTELRHVAAARIGAIAWEAGRRYGVMQALAIITGCIDEYREATGTLLQQALDSTMELPPLQVESEPGKVLPYDYKTAEEAASDPPPDRSSGVVN